VTMKWRARSVLFAVWATVAVLVAVPSTRAVLDRPLRFSPMLAVAIGLVASFYGIAFVAFRCPHCRARQIRGRWDWLLLSDRCWKCHQPLDGPPLPTDVIDEQMVAEVNPTLATEMRRDRLAMEELAQRALTDPTAAEQLRRQLEHQVEQAANWVSVVRVEAPGMEAEAQEDLKRAQHELAQWQALRDRTSGSRLTSA
jgi:hypothetical protein